MNEQLKDFIDEMLGHMLYGPTEAMLADLERSIREFDAYSPDSKFAPSPLLREVVRYMREQQEQVSA